MKNSAMIHLRDASIMRNARPSSPRLLTGALLGATALVATAVVNSYLAQRAERKNPPTGQFVRVDGLDVHYVERGQGPTLVLLHGNGSMLQDFATSGLMEAAAATHRVIAFDRPGFGYTSRPGRLRWGPNEQADLLRKVLDRLDISEVTVLGHSWGASVAVAMGIRHPALVTRLVLISGYYYPTLRLDFLAMATPAMPIIGDLLSQTLSPVISRLMWPALLSKIFGPADVPAKFAGFPEEMAVRPSQIRASAEESALLIPGAAAMQGQYDELGMPVTIIAGKDDKLIDPMSQSKRLHAAIIHSELIIIPGHGHMVHQTATGTVMRAVSDQKAAA
jgi:pimeloyl-ACP methyl ester carboxylesterase